MTCENEQEAQARIAEQLSALIDGELDAESAARLHRELANDDAAQARLAAFVENDAEIARSWNDALAQPAPALVGAVSTAFARRRRRRLASAALRWVGPMAAALAIVVLGSMQVGRWATSEAERAAAAHDEALRLAITRTVQQALEKAQSGMSVSAQAPDADVSVTPIRTYKSASQHWCREFRELVHQPDRDLQRLGVACREADGVWRRVRTTVEGGDVSL